MKYYLAPLEGITTYIFRNAYYKYYGEMDKYFTPFISPNQNRAMSTKERNDILPEHNKGLTIVPQVLTNKSKEFLTVEKELREYGYQELNINLGCPSKTVVTKYKGAGFLDVPKKLEEFLEEIFAHTNCEISVKTRIGISEEEEWEYLLRIYEKFPIKELIIHPRLQMDYYKNKPRMTCFEQALRVHQIPISYNGDLLTKEQCLEIQKKYSTVDRVMIGRGILKNPQLLLEQEKKFDINTFTLFHNEILNEYEELMKEDRNTLFKVKELWTYWECLFPSKEKLIKKIRKSQSLKEYRQLYHELSSTK
ncbi:MAG: tRNA dihydrouridine synthase [Lachnospiraceae bacterium]